MNLYGAVQIGSEFSWLLDKISELKSRKTAVEIGVYKGGTFYAFMQFFEKVIGIDIEEKVLSFKLRSDPFIFYCFIINVTRHHDPLPVMISLIQLL